MMDVIARLNITDIIAWLDTEPDHLEHKIEQIRIEISDVFSPTDDVDLNLTEPLWFGAEPGFEDWITEFVAKPHHWYAVDVIRIRRLREAIHLLRSLVKLFNSLIRLFLRALSFGRRFSHHISQGEKSWRLLHGAHPPKEDAGLSLPALTELGRVSCTSGLPA